MPHKLKGNYLKKFDFFSPLQHRSNKSIFGGFADFLRHCSIDQMWTTGITASVIYLPALLFVSLLWFNTHVTIL